MKRLEAKEVNFLIGRNWTEADKDLLFGPLTPDDEFIVLGEETTFPDVLVMAGVFESKSTARKNGWGGSEPATFRWNERLQCDVVDTPGLLIPNGWTDFRAGKGKLVRISIWKPTKD